MQPSDETTRCYFVSTELSNHRNSLTLMIFIYFILGDVQIQRLGVTCRAADDIPLLDSLSRPLIFILFWKPGDVEVGKAKGMLMKPSHAFRHGTRAERVQIEGPISTLLGRLLCFD